MLGIHGNWCELLCYETYKSQRLQGRCYEGGKISGVDPENIWQISFIPKRVNCERIVCKMDGTTPVSLDALFVIPSLLFSKIQMNSDANLETYTQLEMYGAVDHTAMTTDFLQEVAIPVIEKTCDKVHVEVERTKRGFWPGGDGYLLMRVYALRGGPLNPITTPGSRGKIVNVYVLIFRSGGGFPKKVEDAAKKEIEEQLQQFKTDCGEDFEYDIQTSLETHETAYGAGFGVIATAESKDSWIFGAFEMADLSFSTEQRLVGNELKVAAENEAIQVSTRAINRLKHKLSHNSCIDDQMQSHLLVYMALAAGKSKIFIGRPTLEFLFAKYVVEKTLGIEVRVYSPTKEPNPSQSLWMVTCEGVGYFQGDEIGGFNTNRTT
eukprot:TRINITY_DN20287_c0_g1_i1.p2 TRINITY_DN20287_c0_g1~~TRINITY_DN20287_c0_g1_i1.p2  ORF type:complete len:379 (+),score=77.55 TRINITY_DN20287_c0_g1_i1:612-1748(+)